MFISKYLFTMVIQPLSYLDKISFIYALWDANKVLYIQERYIVISFTVLLYEVLDWITTVICVTATKVFMVTESPSC